DTVALHRHGRGCGRLRSVRGRSIRGRAVALVRRQDMIHFEHVFKRYPNGREALANLTLEIDSGSMTFLTGHSGAGKSTLLKLIALVERPTRGQLIVNK